MSDRDLQLIRCTGYRSQIQPPNPDVVREVLLIHFRIISVRRRPGQITSSGDVEVVAELIVEFDRDIAPNTRRNGTFTATQLKGSGGTWQNGHRYINEFTRRDIVSDANRMGAGSVGLEGRAKHASVGRSEKNGFTHHHVSMLVNHVSGDLQGFISRDCGR